jgi:hypothetical protein
LAISVERRPETLATLFLVLGEGLYLPRLDFDLGTKPKGVAMERFAQ